MLTDAEDVDEVEEAEGVKVKNESLICKLFNLPREIRDKILRHLLYRPIAILPGPVRVKCSIGFRHSPVVAIYSYQWDDRRQRGHDPFGLPTYDGSLQGVQFAWRSKPTKEQLDLINSSAIVTNRLNSDERLDMTTFDEELGADVLHYVLRRGNNPIRIINRAVIRTCGLQPQILHTCKQLYTEGCQILYSENTFVFDTRGQSPYTHHCGVHGHDAFDKAAWQIPSLPNNGRPQSPYHMNNALDYMFEKEKFHQPFMQRDPMSTFFRAIGRNNASMLTSVKLEGYMRTAETNPQYQTERPISFARILPIHATILRNICPNLRKLTIHQGANDELWEDDVDGALGLSNEERVDIAIEGVVNALPHLQELELGSYHFTPSEANVKVQWGKALRWEGLVEERVRNSVRLAREKEERAVLDQYMWKEDKKGGRKNRKATGGGQRAGPSAFASLIDDALAAASSSSGDQGGHRPSFRMGTKNRQGGGKSTDAEN
ncbi:uncharacterized protein LY89DRAFT_759898 [Mollisia scopiformis]|uniref:Uncharacterized protein n=1 Tax=Mollisia scopiformis TaxID=149040 RepID=A0A194WTI1_MOLSC|nr:uncharacterized protein LY89DRAFT_759898 [Mollisia scopiformis]KUJ10922.1 hypothetical protein LY89DRAFT_759898 [Mollisia scopiformis]